MTDDAFPQTVIDVRHPSDLVAVIERVRECLADGTLRQLPVKTQVLEPMDFACWKATDPRPDIVYGIFEDRSGRRYELCVETYHGSGGTWAPEGTPRPRGRLDAS